MKKYFVLFPRNFANEYLIVSAETPAGLEKARAMEAEHASDVNSDFHRITRDQARRMCYSFISLDDSITYNFRGEWFTTQGFFQPIGQGRPAK